MTRILLYSDGLFIMSDFGDKARYHAQKLEYTEYSSREIAINKSKKAGDVLSESLEGYYLDELCDLLDIDSDNLDNPATQFKPYDVALAPWSNWVLNRWEWRHIEALYQKVSLLY